MYQGTELKSCYHWLFVTHRAPGKVDSGSGGTYVLGLDGISQTASLLPQTELGTGIQRPIIFTLGIISA